MKRYLLFQTPSSDFELESPQFALCGNPRIVVLNPNSNASTFLWQQIEPDPLLFPVTILPNANSKNITVSIPSNTPSPITLKVTLNGIDEQFIEINTGLKDNYSSVYRGSVNRHTWTNTLRDLNYQLAPLPILGPQVVQVLNGNTTSIKILNQLYRANTIKSLSVIDTSDNTTNILNYPSNQSPYTAPDIRYNIKVNNLYLVTKTWAKQEVFSEDITNIPFIVNIPNLPIYIADEYNRFTTRGTAVRHAFNRQSFTVKRQSVADTINTNVNTRGTAVRHLFNRQSFTVQRQSVEDNINTRLFTRGLTTRMTYSRIPYSSNVVGG